MAKTNPSTITLKSGGGDTGNTREAVVTTGTTITPGHRVDLIATGLDLAAAAVAGSAFAIEDDLQGKGIGDDYAAGTRAFYRVFQRGDEVYAWLADGETIAVGATLEGAAAGELAALAAGVAVAEALEAVTTSGAAARIRVRIV